jgi:hypothetical protein
MYFVTRTFLYVLNVRLLKTVCVGHTTYVLKSSIQFALQCFSP